ncbi:MAG: hypothetical protein LKG56_04270 [Lachnospiraceae bacterium]|nr:hypothetical protein [Lachnospiraceae bacterium]MCH4032324.1 hypothetical protein [Lachnospiraceae bacterium]MCH4108798.1 hypothetical protein [Lachnospiraceae bacterium]MCI1302329.1 hypothetical protein [Lachnospiraceae bacterium]MCI1331495.1 hypothetical protein [Lachnospiraceae bacterium]
MNSKKSNMFTASFIGVAAVWLGSHFGPGFATGAFSTQWYVQYGWIGLLTPFIAMIVTGGVMYYMTEYARSHKTYNYRPFALSCFGPKFGQVMSACYDVAFLMTLLCAGGLAFAGEGTILQVHLNLPYWVGAGIMIVLSGLLCMYGSKLLSNASAYLMYAIIGVVLLIVILSFIFGDYDLAGSFANSAANAKNSSIAQAILSGILYGCFQSTIVFNVMAVADVLTSRKDTKKAIGFGYLFTVVLMFGLVLMLFSYTNVYDIVGGTNNLPVYSVLQRLNFPWLTWIYVLLMTLAVLTSAAGLAAACVRRFDGLFRWIGNVQLRRFVITVIALGIAALGASFGMAPLLRRGTSIVGYIGIPVVVIPAFTWVAHKVHKDGENPTEAKAK